MEVVTKKITVFLEALQTLEDILTMFNRYKSLYLTNPTEENRQIFLAIRDGTIQRFEYCTDLFWKVLKIYLEEVEKVEVTNISPRGVIRDAIHIKLLSEMEGKECMKMVESRNKTSHIYHAEMAEDIAERVPMYYVLMKIIIDYMQAEIAKR